MAIAYWEKAREVTDPEIERIVRLYSEAQVRIERALDMARLRGNDLTHLEAVRSEIAAILADLDTGVFTWAGEAIPKAYMGGVATANASMGALRDTAFSGIHEQAVQILADNAYNNLTAVSSVIGRQSDDFLRAIALDAITGPVFGVGTTRTAASDIFTRIVAGGDTVIRTRPDDSTYLGFQVTPDGKWWEVANYADMSARTTLADTMRTGSRIRMGEAGVESFIVIGGPDPCEDCQAAIDGSPYTADELDALSGDGGHFTGPNCECDVAADPARLDEAME